MPPACLCVRNQEWNHFADNHLHSACLLLLNDAVDVLDTVLVCAYFAFTTQG